MCTLQEALAREGLGCNGGLYYAVCAILVVVVLLAFVLLTLVCL